MLCYPLVNLRRKCQVIKIYKCHAYLWAYVDLILISVICVGKVVLSRWCPLNRCPAKFGIVDFIVLHIVIETHSIIAWERVPEFFFLSNVNIYCWFLVYLIQAFDRHIPVLIRALGSSNSDLLHIISDPPQGSENLLMLVGIVCLITIIFNFCFFDWLYFLLL